MALIEGNPIPAPPVIPSNSPMDLLGMADKILKGIEQFTGLIDKVKSMQSGNQSPQEPMKQIPASLSTNTVPQQPATSPQPEVISDKILFSVLSKLDLAIAAGLGNVHIMEYLNKSNPTLQQVYDLIKSELEKLPRKG
jgi:hypothetical protein